MILRQTCLEKYNIPSIPSQTVNFMYNDFLPPVQVCPISGVPSWTHWGRVTHICVSDLTSIGSDNGLSPGRRQTILRTNAGILLIGPSGTNFSEFLVEILIFSFKKMRLKVSSAKRRPFCLGPNELIPHRRQSTGTDRHYNLIKVRWAHF